MTTYEEQHALAHDGAFVNRVRQALLTLAADISHEVPTDLFLPAEDYVGMTDALRLKAHEARMRLATRVINNAQAEARRAALLLATQIPITSHEQIDDASLTAVIADGWTAISGFNWHYEVVV